MIRIAAFLLLTTSAFAGDRVYADPRCDGPGRYDAMREGADCSNPASMPVCPPDHPNLIQDAQGPYCVDFSRAASVPPLAKSGDVHIDVEMHREPNNAATIGASPYSGHGH
jgi:hypothetical protein